ncbi:helix-turn-helix transcriptional regulator [Gottfriedia acidiceleris]|uniref:helix-turn-helix transcriptional regulator n=1 Tax=Gottfriedia acidiceleris TaxID=371036 RepID=UPI003D21F278
MSIEIYTAQDIMKILKVSRAKAYEIMNLPDFPLIRIGKCKRVIANEFQNWLINNTHK